jgi:hypothetical protein
LSAKLFYLEAMDLPCPAMSTPFNDILHFTPQLPTVPNRVIVGLDRATQEQRSCSKKNFRTRPGGPVNIS